jgi:hypothetical protein
MAKPIRCPLVEDPENYAGLIVRALQKDGYDVALERVKTVAQMRSVFFRSRPGSPSLPPVACRGSVDPRFFCLPLRLRLCFRPSLLEPFFFLASGPRRKYHAV